MPYRGTPVDHPDHAELKELRALERAAKRRRARAALTLGSLGVGMAVFASVVGNQRRAHPVCHHVTVVLQQAHGTPPPPMEWTTCEPVHDLAGRGERTFHDQSQL